MASELGLNPKIARRAGLLHDIGKVSENEPEYPHAILGAKLAEQYKERPEVCNAIGAHHEEMEMTRLWYLWQMPSPEPVPVQDAR